MSMEDLLRDSKTIAVVGLSSDPFRPSHEVAAYLQRAGYRILPVNPNESAVLGEIAYATLDEVPVPVDIVNIFRRSEFVPDIVDAAIRIKAKGVWMQLDVVHDQAAQKARDAGLEVVMDRCIAVEHRQRIA